ncbi:MAG: tetratricopeptide repeat protein [Verrucomicrobiota bacterium]|jgi:tetratricopeptide (TPR) repeat protein|nr:tetratricopeptide repeat protein [Verrucomicrobiota bacterium]MDP7048565.1 tetratricopeptide repeat protein [Verrucomicrobiota bacterium]
MVDGKKQFGLICALAIWLLPTQESAAAKLSWLEQIEVETFAELRKVERFQLKAAEAFYTKGEFAAAAAEYEKFITLYERSIGAPYAQLMWSHCQVRQRKVYTAIRDGFRSVIDYWPESREAKLSAYLIGRSYKSVGEVKQADAAYGKAIAAHPDDHVAVLSKWDMAEIAHIRKDTRRLEQVWSDLVFNTKLNKQNRSYVERAAQGLAKHRFSEADFEKALKTLQVPYSEEALLDAIYQNAKNAVSRLCNDDTTRRSGEQLADRIITLLLDETINIKPSGDGTDEIRELHRRAGRLHERAGRDLDVVKTYERLAKRIGMDDGVRGSIATWHCAKKRFPKARELYGQFEDKTEGLIHIADTWIEEGQPTQAIRLYQRLAKLEPKRLADWKQAIAGIYAESGQHDKAIEVYQELVILAPAEASTWYWTIGSLYEETKRLKVAIQAYRQSDRYPEAYFQMAKCHRQLKEYTEALTLYHQALATEKVAPDATLSIGYTYEEQFKKKDAIKWFQRTCKLYPRTRNASKAHAHLQKEYGISVTLGGSKER